MNIGTRIFWAVFWLTIGAWVATVLSRSNPQLWWWLWR